MRIGVVGDTHDRTNNVERILTLFGEARVERVVHTGDITRPAVLEQFSRLEVPMYGVFGNNDHAERIRLEEEARRLGMDFAMPPRTFHWAGRQILVVHDPDEAPSTLPTEIDLVLHGHTHRHRHEQPPVLPGPRHHHLPVHTALACDAARGRIGTSSRET